MADPPQTIGVLITTYKRSEELLRCLAALEQQTHPADDVILVVREDDLETKAAVNGCATKSLPIRIVGVSTPGIVSARYDGIDDFKTDLLTMIVVDTSPLTHCNTRVRG